MSLDRSAHDADGYPANSQVAMISGISAPRHDARAAWHPLCTLRHREKTPPDKGTPVARRGRNATGQADRLTAGLPKEGAVAPPKWWSSSAPKEGTRMKRFALVAGIVMLVSLAASAAFAQSSGSFAGDFVSASIIPTIACAATDP